MKTNKELLQSAISLIQASVQLTRQVPALPNEEMQKEVEQQIIYAAKLEVLAWALTDKD